MNIENTVTITKEEYDRLIDDSIKFNALINGGVDNWEGYELAMDSVENGD